mmetsp:Transcript_13900/g.41955  ORF Transcript_13900/g.41955 Transcript_13900/m.41955 type:complete len:99 (-) Transcript_13900:486-782(-)
MGVKSFRGNGTGLGLGAGFGYGFGLGFGGFSVGMGTGVGIGIYAGWGYMLAGIGAEYISSDPPFKEAQTHQQHNPLKIIEAQVQKVFKRPADTPAASS